MHQERCAHRAAWDLAKHIDKLRNADIATFYIPMKARVMQASTSKNSKGARLRSGASMHMMSNKNLSSSEIHTLRRSRNPTVVLSANGEVHTNEEAQVFVHDQNLFVTVQLLEENACCSIAWKTLRRPRIFLLVGQRSKATVDQKREDNCMQNGQLRTSCPSMVIHQFWKHFVGNIDIAGFVVNKSSSEAK